MQATHSRIAFIALLIAVMISVSACNFFAPQQTAPLDLLEDDTSSTQIAGLRATATVSNDRLMGTIEAVQTSIRAVELQSTRISATLIARGTPFIDISMITPLAPSANSGAVSGAAPEIDQSVQAVVTPGGIAQGNATLPTAGANTGLLPNAASTPTSIIAPGANLTATPEAVVNTGEASLTNITTARAVGSDDCAAGSVTTFRTTDTDIYVSAFAQNITSGTLIASRWSLDGTEVVSYNWTPDFNINGACIWFHMPASAVTYTAGSWTVELSLNGIPVGSASFTITA